MTSHTQIKLSNSSDMRPLVIDPERKLEFSGPVTQKCVSTFLLKNLNFKGRFAFKIKSNAPMGRLSVKPKRGFVEPRAQESISIALLPASSLMDLKPPTYSLLIEFMEVHLPEVSHDAIWYIGLGKCFILRS